MSGFRIRRETLADDALIVVRGGVLGLDELRIDATRAFTRFGEHAISVFGAVDDAAVDGIAETRLRWSAVLTLMRAGTIREAGLELRPTFRRPHYSVMLPELDADLRRLLRCENVVRTNPYYEPPEIEP